MLAGHHAPWVKYHNIVGLVPDTGWLGKLALNSDGVVSYDSAHVDDVETELVVPADHSSLHSHPLAVLEVRQILLGHLAELRASPGRGRSRVLTAGRPRFPDEIVPPPRAWHPDPPGDWNLPFGGPFGHEAPADAVLAVPPGG
jgi:hypothetical protein